MRVELQAYRKTLPEAQGHQATPQSASIGFDDALEGDDGDVAARAIAVLLVLLHRHSGQSQFGVDLRDAGAGHLARHSQLQVVFSATSTFAEVLVQVREQRARAASSPTSAQASNVVVAIGDGAATAWDPDVELFVQLRSEPARSLTVQHAANAFPEHWLDDFVDQCGVLMRQVRNDPDAPVAGLSLLTERARSLLPDPTRVLETPWYEPIAETILAWSRSAPTSPAIVFRGRQFSYADLARCADAVIRALGPIAGKTVAVTGVRSFALVAAMIGVLRSGGVLLMLDPRLPLQRRQAMARQSDAAILIRVDTDRQAAGDVAFDMPTLDFDPLGLFSKDATGTAAFDLPPIDPSQPAYVFFTSGSTGTPKAVRGQHAGLAHFLEWQRRTFAVGPGDRASQLTALSFDVVLRDTFLALTAGATLCIPEEDDVLDPPRILRWLEAQQVTTVHVVPSLARMWLGQVPKGVRLPALRRVFFAGEMLSDVLVQQWRKAFPGRCEIVNLYGPTETTLAKFFHRVPEDMKPGGQPVGHALPQTQALILDERHRLLGLNEVGQIAIRTPFRTLGYLGNAEANEKAFIRNPFRGAADDLLYLTGDSGRYGSDGLLEVCGRIDNQVKIRGVRIEPGEIESCLARHPGVRATVVMAREDDTGQKFLVAYVVPGAEITATTTAAAIESYRRHLRERLPDVMVPTAFVCLDSLPLNANGKVDRRALPAPERAARPSAPYVPPLGDLQQRLAALWCEALGLDRVGVDDSFFDIGGHSLLAVQLVRKIEDQLGMPCTLSDLFQAPTIRGLLAAMSGARDGKAGHAVIALQRHGRALPLFCICGIHLYQELADQFAPEVPVFGIFVPGDENLYDSATNDAVSSLSVERMARDYVKAVRDRQPHGPYRLVGVSFGGVLAYEAAQQLSDAGEEVSYLALLDTMLPAALGRNWVRWALEHLHNIRQRGPRELVRKIAGRFNRPGSPVVEPASVADETERLGAIRQAVYRAVTRRYVPKPYRGFAMLVRAEDQAFFKSDIADSTYGWGRLVDRLKISDVPGDHLSILTQPHVSLLAKALRAAAPFDLSAPALEASTAAPAAATSSAAGIAEGDGGETVKRIDPDVVPANPVGLTVKSV